MKKTITFLVAAMLSLPMVAQSCGNGMADGPAYGGNSGGVVTHLDNFVNLNGNSFNYASTESKSQLLFSSWSNTATVETNTQSYTIANVNFDVANATFVQKKDGDKFMSFTIGSSVKRVTINGRSFKSVFSIADGKSKVYEVIHEDNSYAILKNYKVKVRERKMDSYTGRQEKKVTLSSDYYVQKSNNDAIVAFKVNKKNLLQLYASEGISAESIKSFAKENRLSFKKDEDIKRILRFSSNLTNSALALKN